MLERHEKLSEELEALTMPDEFDDKIEEIKNHFNLTTDFDKLIKFD